LLPGTTVTVFAPTTARVKLSAATVTGVAEAVLLAEKFVSPE
jgi:hypothetical protein